MSKKLQYIILHCSATREGQDIRPETIEKWHRDRGWSRPGYAGIITLDGVYHKRINYNDDGIVQDWEITNGVVGINSIARHYCYVGGCDKDMKPKDTRTLAQMSTLINLVLMRLKTNPDVIFAGHNQFAAKACPSFDVPAWLREVGVPEKNIYKKK
jgi:N-acetylmuramoyl-L-alanine amidase